MPSNGVAVSPPSVALALSGRRFESAANDNARRTVTSGSGVEFARSYTSAHQLHTSLLY